MPRTELAERQQLVRLWRRIFQRLLYALVYRARVPVLVVLVLMLGGGTYLFLRHNLSTEATPEGVFPIAVDVQPIENQRGTLVLTLKEKNGNRRIAMDVGGAEAVTIARERGQPIQDAPYAYDLMRDVIQQIGGRVDRVIINDANQTQYFAQVIVSTGGETRVVSARPGDAVALALKSGAPIFVEDRVLEQFGARGGA
jgi:bifunctional DNase/RNase